MFRLKLDVSPTTDWSIPPNVSWDWLQLLHGPQIINGIANGWVNGCRIIVLFYYSGRKGLGTTTHETTISHRPFSTCPCLIRWLLCYNVLSNNVIFPKIKEQNEKSKTGTVNTAGCKSWCTYTCISLSSIFNNHPIFFFFKSVVFQFRICWMKLRDGWNLIPQQKKKSLCKRFSLRRMEK